MSAATTAVPGTACPVVRTETSLEVDVDAYYGAYWASWQKFLGKSPCRQYLYLEEFEAELKDPSVLKFVAEIDGVPVGLAFVATNLGVIPWVDPRYYQEMFPEHFASGRIFYIGSLVVVPKARQGEVLEALLSAITDHVGSVAGIAAFDCSEYMAAKLKWPERILRIGTKRSIVTPIELDSQRYFAYVTTGLRPTAA